MFKGIANIQILLHNVQSMQKNKTNIYTHTHTHTHTRVLQFFTYIYLANASFPE